MALFDGDDPPPPSPSGNPFAHVTDFDSVTGDCKPDCPACAWCVNVSLHNIQRLTDDRPAVDELDRLWALTKYNPGVE